MSGTAARGAPARGRWVHHALASIVRIGIVTGALPGAAFGPPAIAQPAPTNAAVGEEEVAPLIEQALALFGANRAREAVPLAERALALAERRFGPDDATTVLIINALGSMLYAAGDYPRAVERLQRALQVAEKNEGPDSATTWSILNNLANAQQAAGAQAQAQPLLERVLAARERTLGPDHPDTATSLTNLGGLLYARGRYAQAVPLLQRALAIRERTSGSEHADTAAVLNNLGATHAALGDLRAAQAAHERALAIRKKALGETHPLVAASMHNLAAVFEAQGRFDAALAHYEPALALREAALGAEHPLTAVTLNNLAELHHTLAHEEIALVLQRRALAVREKALGADHPETATSLVNVAALLEAHGDYGAAQALYERALTIQRATLGPGHPETAGTINNLAALHESSGDYGRAQQLYEQALQLREQALGPNHPETAVPLNNLAEFLHTVGQLDRALQLQERVLAIRQQALGPEHPGTAASLHNLAAIHRTAGRYPQALDYATRAQAIFEKTYGREHPETARALANLASVHRSMGNLEQALQLELQALALREKARHAGHLEIALSRNNVGTLYLRQGRRAQAQTVLEQAFATVFTLGQPAPLAAVAANLGALHEEAEHFAAAIFYLKVAVNAAQEIRASARSLERDLQRSLATGYERSYRRLARLLIVQGRLGEAELVLQMLKEEEQFEFTQRDARSDPRTTRAALSAAEQQLADGFARNAKELGDALARLGTLDRIKQRNPDEEKERTLLADRLGLLSSQWSELIDSTVQRLEEQGRSARARLLANAADESGGHRTLLARMAAASGARPALVHVLPSQNGTTFLVTTSTGSVTIHGGLGEAALNETIDRLRRAIAARDPAYRTPAGELYQALIAPIAAQLAGGQVDTLMFYLVDGLRYVPLAALIDPATGRHLVEQYALSLYTAAAQTDLASVPAADWTAVALGASKGGRNLDPLPGVAQELSNIVRDGGGRPGGVLPGSRFLDDDFTLARLVALMDGSRRFAVIHLATHFQLVPGSDQNSFLLLGDGDALSLRAIRSDMTLRPGEFDLITLSACETGLGAAAAGAGREVESLGVILQRRGAKAVLATLWKIQDTGTAVMMQAFYRARGESRRSTKAGALRAAQLELLQGKVTATDARVDLRHPYYWAPFVLMGNWL